MNKPFTRDELIDATRSMVARLEPEELDAIAVFAVNMAADKREAAILQTKNFLEEAAKLSVFDFKTLLRIVVSVTGQSRDDILRSRCWQHAKARQILFWLCSSYTKLSTPQIGAMAGRDHSTVLYCINRAQTAREIEKIPVRANPVAWAAALWEAEWPAAYACGRPRRARVPSVRQCA